MMAPEILHAAVRLLILLVLVVGALLFFFAFASWRAGR